MKKSVVILFLLLSINLIFAANETGFEKGFVCLEKQLDNNCGNAQSTAQISFNILAMAHDKSIQSKCSDLLLSRKKDRCWGETSSSNCDIKSTALAIIALNHVGKDVDDYVSWLKSRKKTATGLTWFLELDARNKTDCKINGKKITINEDKKITGTDPAGLVKAYNNYWFKITDLNKNFTISCDSDFISTLLYQRPGNNAIYVSSETHTASANEETNEKVSAYCFGTSSCDYEGTLWATFAMIKTDEDFLPYIPYLAALAEETSNKKYFPSAFLTMFYSSVDEYINTIKSLQKQGKYWDVSGNKFYDTSLAILALPESSEESANAKEYLLSIQGNDGCWSSYTNFILYASARRNPTYVTPITPERNNCEDYNYSCVSAGDCSFTDSLDNFYCSGAQKCCRVKPKELTCSEREGIVCKDGQICTGTETITKDTSKCCLASCEQVLTPSDEESECETEGFDCMDSCTTDLEEKDFDCSNTLVCCGEKTSATKSSLWIFILLIILIILVILAIIFRNQLKLWWFKNKSKFTFKKGPDNSRSQIQLPSRPVPGRPMPRPIQGRPPQYQQRLPVKKSPKDIDKEKEFEDTMKKLREMSK